MGLLAWLTLATWVVDAAYPAFDAWWFLRFLLPTWPAMFLGTAALVIWLFDHRGAWGCGLTLVLLVALGAYGLVVTARRHVFLDNEGERRYATIAHLVAAHVRDDICFHAGRAAVRFDLLDANWFDRAGMWLADHGRHPYVLIEDWEMPAFRKRFAERSQSGDLTFAPALVYEAYRVPGRVHLFDLLRRDAPTLEPPPIRDPRPRCPLPATPPVL